MAVINEDFIRCECGCAEFQERTTVALRKTLKKRNEWEKGSLLPALGRKVAYVCAKCGKELDI